MTSTWAAAEGLPYPLGATYVAAAHAYNFALYSKHATSVQLWLFEHPDRAAPRVAIALDPRTQKSGRIWHCRVAADIVDGCRYYGYVVDGPEPSPPFEAHAFRRDKLLLDPYARAVVFPAGFDRRAALGARPNAGAAPLGVLGRAEPAVARPAIDPSLHEADAVIYELHVGHFTRSPTAGVTAAARGTFAGVVEKIPYLKELGVTIVELMPVFQTDPQAADVWGYMPLCFFAPHRGFAPAGADPIAAFRAMVDALHAANIEVIIDVVFNHTTEGGAAGPTYNFKGLDNSTYYLLTRDGGYADFSGCGNSLNANNSYVRKMIVDSMRYWVREMGVDGFRFDLASVFARAPDGTVALDEPAIFADIASDPLFDGVRLIAEPWDASGNYALGRAFPGMTWLQWNSRFRDDVRRFVRGDADTTGALMQRIYGSDDLFPDDPLHAYHAYQSVNYVTSHDGFTLHDLVAYARKRNVDGAADDYSDACGHDGDDASVPADVIARRVRRAKLFLALLLLANGTPMLRAGDEFLHTQRGHNNPYDVDDATVWLDWDRRALHDEVWRFTRAMIAFRKRHPSLARSRFWRDDVHWFGATGVVDFARPTIAWSLRGAAADDDDLYVMVNAGADAVTFVLQDCAAEPWRLAVDSALATVDLEAARALDHTSYRVEGQTAVVLVRGRAPQRP